MEQSLPAAVRDLKRLMKARGVTQEEMALAWGASRSTVISRLSGRSSFTVEELEMSLEALGLDPVEFHRGVARGFHPELVVSAFARAARKQVRDFHRWTIRKPQPESDYGAEELRRMAEGLESLRFRDAKAARRQALEILRTSELEGDVAATAWGVLGVLERHRGRTAIAGSCFLRALRASPSPLIRACLLQRIAMLVLYNGADAEGALEAILRAREIYLACGELSGVGKTLVDEAVAHNNFTGKYPVARTLFRQALRYLDGTDMEYQFAALQGSAVASVFLEDVDLAAQELECAVAKLPQDCLLARCSLKWLQGEIALRLGQYGEASEYFLAVWDGFLEHDEVASHELVLIMLRVAKTYLLQGDHASLRQALQEVASFEDEFERSKSVHCNALAELIRYASLGEITEDFLEDVYLEMRMGAAAAPPLLPD